ncbi:AAA domain-containing protein [Chitinophaga nivalis]|uniref:AAA domain-containing protein n=1 Tax=Chitinophaga nivalis TaxID=2991709 RepID=A0ABT3ISB5_9BACT|nr:AAA domain-containing protein [Chitinophaga nivalis]MCW3463454.1 AAA domain-containing protein [Chitinophaga nivalis]MCW3486856.1 AAA domain-containing protein [Chitinophaga nivalis]
MKHQEHLPFLKYWRNTLADAARVEINVNKTIHLSDIDIDWQQGAIPPASAHALIEQVERQLNESKGRTDEAEEEWEYLEEVQVLMAPFRVSPLPEYIKLSGETGIFYPFWVRAILNKKGLLKPDEDTFPYIPRVYLEPQVNQNINFTFSHVERIDQAFSQPYTGNGRWKNYYHYLQQTFQSITDNALEQYTTANFTTTYQSTIVVNETLSSAADGIVQLYDYLIEKQETPALLKTICTKQDTPLQSLLSIDEMEKNSAGHIGQMGYEFPLSISQRKSLYHFNQLTTGDILAVNGPPGTGKTTLLQSIVANEVVKSAIRGGEPVVILACSTNNQAVTNIIDSFSHVKQQQGMLYQRWLPELTGFGLYLPSAGKQVSKEVLYFKKRTGGFPTEIENSQYIARATQLYTDKFREYSGIQELDIQAIITHLQSILQEQQQKLDAGIRIWQQYKTIPALISQLNPEPSFRLFEQQQLNETLLQELETNIKALETKVSDYLDKESFWMKLFSCLKFVKEKRATRLKQLFRDCPLAYDSINFYEIKSFHRFFDEKLLLIKQIKTCNNDWQNWKKQHQVHGNPPQTDAGFREAERQSQAYFYDELEKGIKHNLFHLAIHYWEGRWIQATSKVIAEGTLHRNGIEHAKNRWRRFSMLTPCFVSTFYMAPKFFTYSKFIKKTFSGNVYENPPLLDFIDLLIVDEAGQVSPEIGVASFSLAKKAVVVGDTQQIEPVWNVPQKVDFANLLRYTAIKEEHVIQALLEKGFLSSSGSIMKLAQKSSPYHPYPDMERGMLLTEHRRCFDEIIAYCNNLAYNGLLEPKKGPARDTLFPPMQFIPVTGTSVNIGTSRGNYEEAHAIANWLIQHHTAILRHYQQKEAADALKDKRPPKVLQLANLIGIITPFTGQKFILQSVLRKSGLYTPGLTIGTVHALQGAERSIILFSSTYGSNDSNRSYFFDVGVNMLNVAVSRAKEAFIFFGTQENYDKKNNTHSAKLYRHIQQIP